MCDTVSYSTYCIVQHVLYEQAKEKYLNIYSRAIHVAHRKCFLSVPSLHQNDNHHPQRASFIPSFAQRHRLPSLRLYPDSYNECPGSNVGARARRLLLGLPWLRGPCSTCLCPARMGDERRHPSSHPPQQEKREEFTTSLYHCKYVNLPSLRFLHSYYPLLTFLLHQRLRTN